MLSPLSEVEADQDQVDQLDADEGHDQSADAVDQQVAAQDGGRTERPVGYALQGQRNQRNDDESVKDDRRQDG